MGVRIWLDGERWQVKWWAKGDAFAAIKESFKDALPVGIGRRYDPGTHIWSVPGHQFGLLDAWCRRVFDWGVPSGEAAVQWEGREEFRARFTRDEAAAHGARERDRADRARRAQEQARQQRARARQSYAGPGGSGYDYGRAEDFFGRWEESFRYNSAGYGTQNTSVPSVGTAYRTLYVQPGAPSCVVEAAYRALLKIHHPDKGGSEERAKQINQAMDVLRSYGALDETNGRGRR
jgi:hypothetical protein